MVDVGLAAVNATSVDIEDVLARRRTHGAQLAGEAQRLDSCLLCYGWLGPPGTTERSWGRASIRCSRWVISIEGVITAFRRCSDDRSHRSSSHLRPFSETLQAGEATVA